MFKFCLLLVLIVTATAAKPKRRYRQEEGFSNLREQGVVQDLKCDNGKIHFELITGYVYSSADDIIDSKHRTLKVTDCIQFCRESKECRAVNFETGLCILFKTAAGENSASLAVSQLPVFTLYAQKVCLPSEFSKCNTSWTFETTPGLALMEGYVKTERAATSRKNCTLECLNEKSFECKSASYDATEGICFLSEVNRNMGGRRQTLRMKQTSDLIEMSCMKKPQKLCEFQPMKGKILKTVDSVYQDVEDFEECKQRCLQEEFECHSYDFMSAGTKICRLSHHSSASLSHIQEPYIEVENTTTYELRGCYQIDVECRAKGMTAKIRTTSLFDGKVYVKSRPNTCVVDAENSTSVDFELPYNDVQCDVIQEAEGMFSANIVVQNHDMIVTSADVGLALHCKYDLQNATVTNSLLSGLEVKAAEGETVHVIDKIVISPNVTMRITTRNGEEVPSAQVGDELALLFQIMDPDSPFELFVRELVALDGQDNSEIVLIDEHGCPTDTSIMGAVNQLGNGKSLKSLFQAFKFPASDVVQFRALVTPCMPKCEPTICNDFNVDGLVKESYGRKRRSIDDQSLLVARSVRITDNFSFKDMKLTDAIEKEIVELDETCVSFVSVIISAILFLVSQVVILMVWSYLWHKKRATKHIEPVTGSLPEEIIYGTLSSRHTSTSRMTD